MVCLTKKGWVVEKGIILTGVLAYLFEHIILWLNNETKNIIKGSQKNSHAIVKIRIEFGEMRCEAYIYPQNDSDKDVVRLTEQFRFVEHIDELIKEIGENKEISAKLINI